MRQRCMTLDESWRVKGGGGAWEHNVGMIFDEWKMGVDGGGGMRKKRGRRVGRTQDDVIHKRAHWRKPHKKKSSRDLHGNVN